MIDLFYITNDAIEAQIVDRLDINWIFLDLEFRGKHDRQAGRNTVMSKHSIADIAKINSVISETKLLVRCNPMGPWSPREIDQLNNRGSIIDMVMLPYFKTPEEVETFLNLLDTSQIEPALLVETMDAVSNLESILKAYPFKYVHVGLNDLHIERGTVSMFQPYIDGLMGEICEVFLKNKQRFGVGGIGRLGSDLSPTPESILREHYRLNSTGVILSRSFKGAFSKERRGEFKEELRRSVNDLRSLEKGIQRLNQQQLLENFSQMKRDLEKSAH